MFRFFLAGSLGLLLAASTGCVVRPLNNQEVFNNGTVFQGFTASPNLDVHIQAFAGKDAKGRDQWDTLGTVKSNSHPYRNKHDFNNGEFYFWNAGWVPIPDEYWMPGPLGFKVVTVRAAMDGGILLPTYEERPNLRADPIQQWLEHGTGSGELTLIQRE